MSTITKERLTELSRRENVGAILGEEIAELARIALASLEADPVCVIDEANLDYLNAGSDADVWPVSRTEMGDVLLYRAAPPAPVSVPDAMEMDDDFDSAFEHGKAVGWNAYRAAMLQGADGNAPAHFRSRPAQSSLSPAQGGNSPVIQGCQCLTCRPVTFSDSRFVVCPECGNKRCPHANDHRNACTGSNEPGQEGSAYPAAPQQEE
ncbi:hypothetical protein AB9B64_21440 [Enterobacter hormaechei]|uniref:hypothetical protein n=1 Tax=Enterobacter cloacae complex TaxID=354276 RepID=UPI000DCB43F0|nr:hypothetical protein [Enterobacter hormaechei]RAZ07084.1 hypothetical protein DP197_16270 [Enterobacter hormaechei subsp. xiangfangensis]RAZ36084.1 hypothetical protein DP189_03120 [Enterobacter hormaechei subsp. xiangfangensis]